MNAALLRSSVPRIAPTASALPAAPQGASRAQGWVEAVLARPLFAPDRRPPSGAAPGAGPVSLPRLTGIMISGERRSVMFAARDGAKPMVVEEGGEVSGFRVKSIEPGQVTVSGPRGPLVLRPSFDPAPRPAASGQPLGIQGIAGLPGFGAPAAASAR